MSAELTVEDFAIFFEEVHGSKPFLWQKRLLAEVTERDQWPAVLDLPTGYGKTTAMDVAVL